MIFKTLTMENIRSYKYREIEFPLGTSLFEGDIGSGKSTILMAIEFALFGLGNQRGDSLLRKGSKKGSVLLEFESDGKKYEVYRTLIRKEKTGHVRQDKGLLGIDGKKLHLSPTEIKEKILDILNFKEPLNPRAQSVIFRYAVYTPQEEMKYILSQKPDLRLQTLRKAFGIEDYKIAAENATIISRHIKDRINYLDGQTADLEEKRKELSDLIQEKKQHEKSLKGSKKDEEILKTKLKKQKEDLEKLRKSESMIKQIKAQIPHLNKQIEDKNKLLEEYKKEIESAEDENRLKLEPQIEKLKDIKKPTTKNEDELIREIAVLKKIEKKRDKLVTIVFKLNEDKKSYSEELGKYKDKKLNEVIAEIESVKKEIKNKSEILKQNNHDLKNISEKKHKTQANKIDIQQKLDDLDGIGKICPICGNILDEEHKQNLKKERENLIAKLNNDFLECERLENKYETKINSLEGSLDSLKEKSINLNFMIDKLSKFKTLKKKLNTYSKEIKNLDAQLTIIEEPKFPKIGRFETSVDYLEALLDELRKFNNAQELLDELQFQLQKNNDKINKNDITQLKRDIIGLDENLSKVKEESKKHKGILGQIEKLKSSVESAEEDLKSIRKDITSRKTLIKKLKDDIKKVEAEVKKKEKLKKLSKKLHDYHIWINDYLIPTFDTIEKHVMITINQEFNRGFQKWFGLLIDDPSKNGRIDEDFTPLIEQDGYEQDIDYLSGGEKTSVALAYRLALNNIVQKISTGMKSNLLILDEPTDGFSKEQLFKVREILNELKCPQIIIVSHEKELESFADHIFKIEKIDGDSQIST